MVLTVPLFLIHVVSSWAVPPALQASKLLNNTMKTHQNPFKTTVQNLKRSVDVRRVVRDIQNKIITYGVASDDEMEYLRQHTDWDRVNPRRESNLG
jgi:uncharacterized membrane protein YjjP (DUF1212 family)